MAKDKGAHIAAPISFMIGEDAYLLTPPRLKEFRELEQHLRTLPFKELKSQIDGLPEIAQKHLAELATIESRSIQFGNDKFNQYFQSFDGIAYMLWMMLRPARPTMTLADCVTLLNEHFDAIEPQIKKASNFTSDPQAGTLANPKTSPSTSAKSTAS